MKGNILMSNIERYRAASGLMPSKASRAIARINVEADIDYAVVQAQVEHEIAVADGISAVAVNAANRVAELSRLEVALVEMVPAASGRVNAIMDIATIAMTNVVSNAARRIG